MPYPEPFFPRFAFTRLFVVYHYWSGGLRRGGSESRLSCLSLFIILTGMLGANIWCGNSLTTIGVGAATAAFLEVALAGGEAVGSTLVYL